MAKKNKISGRVPKGCFYFIGIYLIGALIVAGLQKIGLIPETEKSDKTEQVEPAKSTTKTKKKKKSSSKAAQQDVESAVKTIIEAESELPPIEPDMNAEAKEAEETPTSGEAPAEHDAGVSGQADGAVPANEDEPTEGHISF